MGIPTSTNPRDCVDGIPDGADVRPYVNPPGIFGNIAPLPTGTWIGFDGNGNPRKHRRAPYIVYNTQASQDAHAAAVLSAVNAGGTVRNNPTQPGDETY
jgi:hypothetical protein